MSKSLENQRSGSSRLATTQYSLVAVWRWELERSQVGGTEDPVIELAPEEPEPPPAKALRWYEITPAKAETQADAGKLEIACD